MAFSRLEKAMALVIGIDIATPGFSRAAAKAAVAAIGRIALPTARAGSALAAANPMAVGGALGLGALQTAPGQELLAMAEERGRADRVRFEQALTDLTIRSKARGSKAKTNWNRAITAGMKAVRASTSYGKKGLINNSRKALVKVTKTAAKVKKTGKVEKKGIGRKIGLAVKKFFGKIPGGRLA